MSRKLVVLLTGLITVGVMAAVALPAVRSSQASLYGNYVASLSEKGLKAAGVDTVNVGPPGVWHLSIKHRSLAFLPPRGPNPGSSLSDYPLVRLTASRITLGPNLKCSTKFGRTHNSIFRLAQTAAGLRFSKVTIACPEDGGALTVAAWRKK